MDINFNCIKCGQYIVIDESGAGLKVNCPKCETDLIVPASKGASPLPPQSEPLVYVLREREPLGPGSQGTSRNDFSTSNTESGGEQPATDKQKSYLSQLGIAFDTSTLTKSQASLLITQEKRRLARKVPATENQKAFLADLGVKVDDPSLCLEDASRLISEAMPMKPVTTRQAQKLRRLGYTESVSGMTAEQAATVIGTRECSPPTEEQYAIAHKCGFSFLKVRDFNAGQLDDVLKCADRIPSAELLQCLVSFGVRIIPTTELEARLLYELGRTYNTCMADERNNACLAAMKDPEFYAPLLDSHCQIKWRKQKRKEWFAGGNRLNRATPISAGTVIPLPSALSATPPVSDTALEVVRGIGDVTELQKTKEACFMNATTQDGKRVILHEDGKWEYEQEVPSQIADVADFRHAVWGMTRDEVMKSESLELKQEVEGALWYDGVIGGLSCHIIFILASNRFVRAKYSVTEQYSVTIKYLSAYEELKNNLTEKYGKPKDDVTYWLDKTFKDDPNEWGTAVSLGHVSLFATWEKTKTIITLALTGDNGSINFGIEYLSKTLGQLEEKQKHDRLINDL